MRILGSEAIVTKNPVIPAIPSGELSEAVTPHNANKTQHSSQTAAPLHDRKSLPQGWLILSPDAPKDFVGFVEVVSVVRCCAETLIECCSECRINPFPELKIAAITDMPLAEMRAPKARGRSDRHSIRMFTSTTSTGNGRNVAFSLRER